MYYCLKKDLFQIFNNLYEITFNLKTFQNYFVTLKKRIFYNNLFLLFIERDYFFLLIGKN